MNHKKSKCRESDSHLIHVLLFVLFLFNLPYSNELQLVNFFPPPSPTRDTTSINFTHITVDSSSGNVYVGATNWLYQLTTNLSVEHAVRTGPVLDGPMCSPIDCSGIDEQSVRLSNNTNKVLVVDPSSRMLISCGSAHQGSCRRHSLTDVRQAEPLTGFPVAANDENSSTVAFVGLAKYYGVSYVLYVGASNSKLGPYRELVPAISSRSLEPGPRLFSIIEKSFQDTARVDISYHLRDYFIVKYIYGFQSGEHVYFATVQKKSHFRALEEWGHVTRLARVCSSDAGFHSYTEITISCIGSDGTDYSLLQDATVVRVGSTLARNMGLSENDEVFIGTFATPQDHSLTPSGSSAVCMFSLADIERGFMENIHLCFNGSVSSRNMDYIAGSMNECPEPRKSQNIVNFCNEPLKLNGSVPLRTSPVVVFPNITVTAITTSTNRHQTFAFLGTSSGSLKQIHIMSPTTAEEMGEIPIDPGHPILEDISHDSSGKFIFVLSPYRVAKVRVDGRQEATTAQLLPKQVSSSNATHHGMSSIPEYSVTPGVDDPTVHHIQRSQTHNNRRDSQHVNGAISGIEISPIIVCLLSAAAVGVLMVIILIGVTSIRRKGSGSSSFSGNDMGNHRLFSSASDAQELKFPPPLITSNSKPLPLIPLTIDREAMFEKGFSSQIVNQRSSLSPPDSQVNAIYSEINELNIDRREDDSVLLSSSTTTTATTDDHLLLHHSHPLINHHSSRQHLVNQLPRESGPVAGCEGLFSNTANSTSSSASGNRMPTAYPPFITFNTIGRSRNTSNPYTFHDSMTRITKPVTSSSPSAITAVTLSNKGASPQTYAVYTYDKLSRGGRGRDSKGSFTSSTSSPSPSTRDRFV